MHYTAHENHKQYYLIIRYQDTSIRIIYFPPFLLIFLPGYIFTGFFSLDIFFWISLPEDFFLRYFFLDTSPGKFLKGRVIILPFFSVKLTFLRGHLKALFLHFKCFTCIFYRRSSPISKVLKIPKDLEEVHKKVWRLLFLLFT